MLDNLLDIPRAEREYLRWILLLALWYARPVGTSEGTLLRASEDAGIRATQLMVRQELNYLKGCNLILVNNENALWTASILPDGENIVDYRKQCPEGIARPAKWT